MTSMTMNQYSPRRFTQPLSLKCLMSVHLLSKSLRRMQMIQHMGTVLKLSTVFYRDSPIFQLNQKQVLSRQLCSTWIEKTGSSTKW
uniref:Alternative protein CDH6 n=1 Tax=Homo sapiens TaxID=9606 RepID=L8EAC6_HUMAN|nr:alternative protein CDH6 [Homo sapiens]